MPTVKTINPSAFGPKLFPYSEAVVGGDLIFLAGQVALDADNNIVGPGDSYVQGKVIIDRIRVILAEAGATLDDVCSATVYYGSRDAAEGFNRAWVEAFGEHRPARAALVTELLVDAAVEVQAVAVRPSGA